MKVRGGGSGIVPILASTLIAGVAGYLIQLGVPGLVSTEDYLSFTVLWSAVYLGVATLSGLQQAVASAVRPIRNGETGAARTLTTFTLAIAAGVWLIVAVTSPLWTPSLVDVPWAGLAIATALGGYVIGAILGGTFSGLSLWGSLSSVTALDALLRVVLIGIAVALGLHSAGLAWGIAVPFVLAPLLVLAVRARRVAPSVALNVSVSELVRRSTSTVGGSLAAGAMINGLPLILAATVRSDPQVLASLILIVSLVRAPILIPLTALQTFLIVRFRDHARPARQLLIVSGLLAGATLIYSTAAAFAGPWILNLIYGDRFIIAAVTVFLVSASAGSTALLYVTGAALLGRGLHQLYAAGWAVSAVLVLALLFGPQNPLVTVPLVLLIAPLGGVLVHMLGLRRR